MGEADPTLCIRLGLVGVLRQIPAEPHPLTGKVDLSRGESLVSAFDKYLRVTGGTVARSHIRLIACPLISSDFLDN